jgi:hypothetical protein
MYAGLEAKLFLQGNDNNLNVEFSPQLIQDIILYVTTVS